MLLIHLVFFLSQRQWNFYKQLSYILGGGGKDNALFSEKWPENPQLILWFELVNP